MHNSTLYKYKIHFFIHPFVVFQSFTTYSSSLETPFIMTSTNHIINITELKQATSVCVPHGSMCERVFACLCWSHGLRLSAAPPLCCLYLLNYYGHHEQFLMGHSGSSWEGAYSAMQSLLNGQIGIITSLKVASARQRLRKKVTKSAF